MNFIIHNKLGEILRTGSCPNAMVELQAHENECMIEGKADDSIEYVDPLNKKVSPRPINPAIISGSTIIADSVNSLIVTDIPTGSEVLIENESFNVTDSTFEFSVDLIGVYVIKIKSFPFLDVEFEVTAS